MKKETLKNIFESLFSIIKGIIAFVALFFILILFFVILAGLEYLVSLIPYIGLVLEFMVGLIIILIVIIIAIINFGSGSDRGYTSFRRG